MVEIELVKHEQICDITGGKYKKYSREMEAEKVDPRVCNIKVYVNGKSAELQKKLFELGCRWYDGTKNVQNTDFPFLYVNQEGAIQSGSWMSSFIDMSNREENVDKVLAMPPVSEGDEACTFKYRGVEMTPISEEECEFTDYDLVLGRDRENQEWNIDFFVKLGEEPYKYECFRDSYKYCIPYIGNEHLAGKIN
jgi:hypothetical protein